MATLPEDLTEFAGPCIGGPVDGERRADGQTLTGWTEAPDGLQHIYDWRDGAWHYAGASPRG